MQWLIPIMATGAVGFLLIVLLVRYFVRPYRSDVLPVLAGPGPARRVKKAAPLSSVLLLVGAAFIASRALVYLCGLIFAQSAGQGQAYMRAPLDFYMRWDANHYVGLAQNWYVNEGDARLHLVFFPLYPLILRGLHLWLSMDVRLAGVLVSCASHFLAGWALFRLTEMEMGSSAARRAVYFLMFSPLTLFYSIPYSESLFLCLTVACVLMARRRAFWPAIVLGALASATRLLGLLCAVPVFYEFLLAAREKKGGAPMIARAMLATMLIGTGFAAYLLLNYTVSGNPLTFLTYQREHWSQNMGTLYNTLSYTTANALSYGDSALRWGTWIPQILAMLCAVALLAAAYRRVSAGDGAFALLYIYFALTPTWLLSGPRYLSAMYAIYPMLASLTARPWRARATLTLSGASLVYMTYMFVARSGVL